jgi:hypothetical protein
MGSVFIPLRQGTDIQCIVLAFGRMAHLPYSFSKAQAFDP